MQKKYIFAIEIDKEVTSAIVMRRQENGVLEEVAQATQYRNKGGSLDSLLRIASDKIKVAVNATRDPKGCLNVSMLSNYELPYALVDLLDFFVHVDETFLDYFLTIVDTADGSEQQ